MGRPRGSWVRNRGPKPPPEPPVETWPLHKIAEHLGHDVGIAFRYCDPADRGKLAGLLRAHAERVERAAERPVAG
jgi:hypothetical protein